MILNLREVWLVRRGLILGLDIVLILLRRVMRLRRRL